MSTNGASSTSELLGTMDGRRNYAYDYFFFEGTARTLYENYEVAIRTCEACKHGRLRPSSDDIAPRTWFRQGFKVLTRASSASSRICSHSAVQWTPELLKQRNSGSSCWALRKQSSGFLYAAHLQQPNNSWRKLRTSNAPSSHEPSTASDYLASPYHRIQAAISVPL